MSNTGGSAATFDKHAAKAYSPRRDLISGALSNYGVFLFLLLMIAGFGVYQPSLFLTWQNFRDIQAEQAIYGILVLAVLFPLAAGEFDLSVGANVGFTAIVTALLAADGVPIVGVFAAALATGLLIGSVNAFFVVLVRVNAFIATLAVSTLLAGTALMLTGGSVIFEDIPEALASVAQTRLLTLPVTFFYCALLVVIVWVIFEYTPYGRFLRATGSGRQAAALSGVKTHAMLASAFMAAGLLCGLVGFLQTAKIGSASPSAGPGLLLPAYAAAFLGATVFKRGVFSVWGSIVGVYVLAVGINGLTLSGAPFWVPNVFNGCALLIAVSFSQVIARRRGELSLEVS